MGSTFTTRTIVSGGSIGSPMTAAFIAIARRPVAARCPFSPHAPRPLLGIIAGTIITAFIASPTPPAFFAVTVARWRTHFIAVIVARTEAAPVWWAIETTIG
jgi:hypothetical protein